MMDVTLAAVDPTVSSVSTPSRLVPVDQGAAGRDTPDTNNDQTHEVHRLVAFAAEQRGEAALPSSAAPLVNPGTLMAELLKRLDPFLQKAHAFGKFALPKDELFPTLVPSARSNVALASLGPATVHPGPARKSFDMPDGVTLESVKPTTDGVEAVSFDGLDDDLITKVFGSQENFKEWRTNLIGEVFRNKAFAVQLALMIRGLRGMTDAVSTLTRAS